MPIVVDIPNRGRISFKDGTSNEDIDSIISQEFQPTGEDVAVRLSQDRQFTPTLDEFKLYKDFTDKQSTDYLSGIAQALPQLAEDVGKGIVGTAKAFTSADQSLAATGVEAFAQGTRNLYGMLAQAENPSSPLFQFKAFLTSTGSPEEQYSQFLKARDFAAKSDELESGNQTLIAKKDEINPEATKALSMVLDPTLLFGPVKGLAAAGHLGESALKAAQAINRVEGMVGKAGLMAAEKAGTAAQATGEAIGSIGKTFANQVNNVADFTGIPREHARTLLGGALGAGIINSPDVIATVASTALAGGLLNRGGEVIANAAKIAQEGIPSRLGVLERVAMSPTVSEPARKLASALAQAQPVYRFVGDVAQGAAEGAAIGSTLGYLSTGTAEGAGSGAGAGIGLGAIGGGIGSFINIGPRKQEGALGDITRFLDTVQDPVIKQRISSGLDQIAGKEQNYRKAAATIDAVNAARERGIGVSFLESDNPAAAFYDPKSNTINLNPDKWNSGSAVHELDHAIRTGIIGKAYSEGLRESILGVKDQSGNTVKPGITDLNGLADVASNISEQYKANPAEAERFKQFSDTLRSDIPENDKAEAIGSVIDELTAIYSEKLFTRKGMEGALTKRLPLFYRNLIDSVSQRIYDKVRTNLYERGTPIPVGKDIKYAFTDDKGKLIRIPELDALIENAMNAQYGSEAAKPRAEVEIAKEQIKNIKEYQTLAKAKTAEEIAVQRDIQNAERIQNERKKAELLAIKNKQNELKSQGETAKIDLISERNRQNEIKTQNLKDKNDLVSALKSTKDEKNKQRIRSEIAKVEKSTANANAEIAKAEKAIWKVEKEIAKANKESARAESALIQQKKAEEALARSKAAAEKATEVKPASTESTPSSAPLSNVIDELDLSHRFTKNAAGEYSERPSGEVEALGKKLNRELLARVAAVSNPGDPTPTEVTIGAGKGLSLKNLNETQLKAAIDTVDLPQRAKDQIYRDWQNLRDPSMGVVQETTNYKINNTPYGSSKTIKMAVADRVKDDHLVYDIVLTPKRGILQRSVNTTRVKDALARLIHEPQYKGLYNTPGEALGDLQRYLTNLTQGANAIESAKLFGGGSKGEKTRNLFHNAMGFYGDAPERPAGFNVAEARKKGFLPGEGNRFSDLNYYHIESSIPTGEKWNFTAKETLALGNVNFQPQSYTPETVGDSKVYDHKFGYRIIQRGNTFTAYGKQGDKLGSFNSFESANKQLINQYNKEYATNQRVLAKEYEQEYLNRNEARKASETGGSNRLLGSKESSQEGGKINGTVRQERNVKYQPETIIRNIGSNKDFANPPTDVEAINALSSEKKSKFGKAARDIKPGTQVAARIDIPAFLRNGKYVVALHEPDGPSGGPGKVIGYDTIVRLQNPKFVVKPGVQRIYEGKANKFPVATVDGQIMADRSIPSDIDSYVPVGMDPKEHAYFYDKRTDQPVVSGSESISVGNTVFVKNPVYGDPRQYSFQPDPTIQGALNFSNGYKALPGKKQGSLRIYAPTGGLVGIVNGIEEAQRVINRKL